MSSEYTWSLFLASVFSSWANWKTKEESFAFISPSSLSNFAVIAFRVDIVLFLGVAGLLDETVCAAVTAVKATADRDGWPIKQKLIWTRKAFVSSKNQLLLTHFIPLISFDTPWKLSKKKNL